jgi:hypothetical protein
VSTNLAGAIPETGYGRAGRSRFEGLKASIRNGTLAGPLAGGLVGLVIALQALDPGFIAGTGGKWIRPENDYNAYLVAWNYFVVDAWRFPLFSLPQMGFPEGGSILFNDALPLASLATKILYGLTGVRVNPFGWWIFLTYILQGVMAARVVQSVGVRSTWACASAAALAVVSSSFVARMGHTALSSHFLLLWAIALHFSSLRQERAKHLEATALLAITLLVNAYLFAMVFAIVSTTLCALWVRRQFVWRDVWLAALGMTLVAASGILAGYGPVVTNPTAMKSVGFGLYSWNLTALLLPPDGLFGFLDGVTRSATHGQYEGEAYIGRGALLLLAFAVVWAPLRLASRVRRYWMFCAMLLALAAFAASNRVYAGGSLLLSYELPQLALDLANYFRATGRFIWPLAYALTLLPLACLFRWWRPLPAMLAAGTAVFLQLSEASPGIRYRRVMTTQAQADLIDAPRVGAWLAEHQRLWQFPSWDCGGLIGSDRRWPSDDSNRELQLQLAAARAGVPTNSVYMSRALKDCAAEAAWQASPQLEDGVLYVLGKSTVDGSPALSALTTSSACVALDWAVVCSSKWVRR